MSDDTFTILFLANYTRKLKSENEKMRSALNFYANPANWYGTDKFHDGFIGASDIDGLKSGGKRARAVLAEIERDK